MGIRRQIYLSSEQDAAIKAAAGKNEEPATYIRRVALEHAAGEWKASGATDLHDAVTYLRENVAAAGSPQPQDGHVSNTVSDQARQLKQVMVSMNNLIKVVLDMQTQQKAILASSRELTAAVGRALL